MIREGSGSMGRISRFVVTVAVCIFTLSPSTGAKTIYVDANAPGLNNGSSWGNAYRCLQDALANANNAREASEIRVAAGTYKPDQGAGVALGDPNAAFHIGRDMTVRGGYAGVRFLDPNARDFTVYPTILSGDLAGNDALVKDPTLLSVDPTRSDNSRCVILVDGLVQTASFDGLTVNGVAGWLNGGSAGLCVAGLSAIMVTDCAFVENASGGISCPKGSIRASRCRFVRNWAIDGGGICLDSGFFWLEDCTFSQNVACGQACADTDGGGGFYCRLPAEGSAIRNSAFVGNAGSAGGGACFGVRGSPGPAPRETLPRYAQVQVTGCTFIGNKAGAGGALCTELSTLEVVDCEFRANIAVSAGGAVESRYSGITLGNCLFSGNVASTGAAVASRSESYTVAGHDPVLQPFDLALANCTLVGNRARAGGAIECVSSGTSLVDTARIASSILDDGIAEVVNQHGTHLVVTYSDIRTGAAAVQDPCNALVWGPGNIDADPLFAAAGHWDPNGTPADANDDFWVEGDYHLKSQAGRWDPNGKDWVTDSVTSPCIDAGDPNSRAGEEPEPNGGRVNMGAYGGTAEASKSGGEARLRYR
jgi:hypothetical protein